MLTGGKDKKNNMVLGVVFYSTLLVFSSLCMSAPPLVTNVDVFDKAGNKLFYVLFEYDGSEVLTGRSIYDADSTFLNHSVIKKESNGTVSAEDYTDYKEDTIYQSTRPGNTDGGELNFLDNYNKEKLVLHQTYKKGAVAGSYDFFNTGGKRNHTIAYQFTNTGAIARIEISDKSGVLTHYATVAYKSTGIAGPHAIHSMFAGKLILYGEQRMKAAFTLEKSTDVAINIYDLSGRVVCCLMDRKLTKGNHSCYFNLISDNHIRSSGVYFVNVTIAGVKTIKKINILK